MKGSKYLNFLLWGGIILAIFFTIYNFYNKITQEGFACKSYGSKYEKNSQNRCVLSSNSGLSKCWSNMFSDSSCKTNACFCTL